MVCQTSILTRVVSSCQRCLRPGSKCVSCCVICLGGGGGVGQKRSKDLRPYVMLHSFIIFRTWTHTSCYGNSIYIIIYIYVSRELLLRLHMTWMLRYTWRGWSKAGVTFKDQSYCNACTRDANVHSVLTVQERGRQQQSHLAFLAIRYPINFVNIVKTSLIQALPNSQKRQALNAWTPTGHPWRRGSPTK